MGTMRLEISVKSALSPYVATTSSGRTVATLHRNAWPKQPWVLAMAGREYRITHEVASNKLLLNDFRYALMDGEATLASCIATPAVRTTEVLIGDVRYHLVRRNRFLSIRYALEDGQGRALGSIVETTGFSFWRRKFQLAVPDSLGKPQAMFLFYLVANFSFR